MCLSLSMRIQKNFKNFKISSQHPISEAFGRFLDTFGYLQEPRERLFRHLHFYRFSTNSSETPPKFCFEDAGISPARIPKTHLHISYTPLLCASQRPKNSTISPKNFRQLSTRLYRTCRQDTTLGANICKRVHSNTSLLGFTPASPEPSKMCRAKQLQARMHVDANIHS